jgi:hypothetical protein
MYVALQLTYCDPPRQWESVAVPVVWKFLLLRYGLRFLPLFIGNEKMHTEQMTSSCFRGGGRYVIVE